MTGPGSILIVVRRDQGELYEYFRWGFEDDLYPRAGARDWGTLSMSPWIEGRSINFRSAAQAAGRPRRPTAVEQVAS